MTRDPRWPFVKQGQKWGYQNNPWWTKTLTEQHFPCGYWHADPTIPYTPFDGLPVWDVSTISLDREMQKLYTTCCYQYIGTKAFYKIFETDLRTFTHSNCWGYHPDVTCEWTLGENLGPDCGGPYFDPALCSGYVWWVKDIPDEYMLPVATKGQSPVIQVLNARTNELSTYTFDLPESTELSATFMCKNLNRLYYAATDSFYTRLYIQIGYIDLDSGNRSIIVEENGTIQEIALTTSKFKFSVYPEQDTIIATAGGVVGGTGRFTYSMRLWDMSGDVKAHFNHSTASNFPWGGARKVILKDGVIYAVIRNSEDDDPSWRGVYRLTLDGSGEYLFPYYAPAGDCDLFDIDIEDNLLFVKHRGYGIGMYDIESNLWRLLHDWDYGAVVKRFKYAEPYIRDEWLYGIKYNPEDGCVYAGIYEHDLPSGGPWTRNNTSHPDHYNLQWYPHGGGDWYKWLTKHSAVDPPMSLMRRQGISSFYPGRIYPDPVWPFNKLKNFRR